MILDEIFADGSEELFVGSGVGSADVIDGIDNSPPHEIGPNAIHDGPREIRVLGAGEPLRERNAAVFGGIERNGNAIERRGGKRAEQTRMIDIARGLRENDNIARFRAGLLADAREEVGHLVILLLRPLFQWMIVAAGASDALPHESEGDVFGEVDGVFVQDEIIQRAHLARVAG